MASFYEKNHHSQEDSPIVLIGNADCLKDADRLQELIKNQNPNATIITHDIGATIGSHVGAGMISISFWGDDRRKKTSVTQKLAAKIKKNA